MRLNITLHRTASKLIYIQLACGELDSKFYVTLDTLRALLVKVAQIYMVFRQGKMFEDELNLAYTVINGVQARGERGNYSTYRVKFNSNPSG